MKSRLHKSIKTAGICKGANHRIIIIGDEKFTFPFILLVNGIDKIEQFLMRLPVEAGFLIACFCPPIWRIKQHKGIFSDSIAGNIAPGVERIDKKKLRHAAEVANIHDFIEELPLGYNTKIGQEGHGLSQGQKQRILIARAVYKDPEFIFFDEATNALDANNERIIMNNLQTFFKGRTSVVVAHRLSTVRNAEQIIVIEQGKIAETGTHETLIALEGRYYQLVKNQLEL